MEQYRGTTICSVRRGDQVVMVGDGQVTLGNTIMKANARKVRRLYKGNVIAGFAGTTAARTSWPECFSSLPSKRSNNVNASAVVPANPAITLPL